ncbi:MAG: YdeI/OmpD-associated family protein [Patescibacteria group bacterium]
MKLSDSTAHNMPADLLKALTSSKQVTEKWESLTPLAQNEWICWNVTVKQQKTRDEHIKRTVDELINGKRRPCCWIGCIHRADKAISPSVLGILNKRKGN